jgi:hypothetical protein
VLAAVTRLFLAAAWTFVSCETDEGQRRTLASVKNNFQRLNRHSFEARIAGFGVAVEKDDDGSGTSGANKNMAQGR